MIPTTFSIENWICLTLCEELLCRQLLLLLLYLLVMLLFLNQLPMVDVLRCKLVVRWLSERKLLILNSNIILHFT